MIDPNCVASDLGRRPLVVIGSGSCFSWSDYTTINPRTVKFTTPFRRGVSGKARLLTRTSITKREQGDSIRPLVFVIGSVLVFAKAACGGADVLDKVSLSVYGLGHVSADLNDNGDNADATIASNSSRLGFRGGVELSHELSIIAQYENGVDLTARGINDGNGGTSSGARVFTMIRDSFAGLHHERFGELVAGRVGALNQYVYDYNLFSDQIGDLGNLWHAHGLFDRINGAMQYQNS